MVRNAYGAIIPANDLTYAKARDIIWRAIDKGRLPYPYVDLDAKKRGTALNIDVYDVRGSTVLVQVRHTTGTKYGLSPRLDYKRVRVIGRGTRVEPVANPLVIKRMAKLEPKPGAILKRLAELEARNSVVKA
jgi:hypothetical protein